MDFGVLVFDRFESGQNDFSKKWILFKFVDLNYQVLLKLIEIEVLGKFKVERTNKISAETQQCCALHIQDTITTLILKLLPKMRIEQHYIPERKK